MNLQNPFSLEVRNLFIDVWSCYECGQNGQSSGGLALHHIWGRISGSACNAAVLCTFCHERVTGALEERLRYFRRTFEFLLHLRQCGVFKWGPVDEEFVKLVYPDVAEVVHTMT